MTARPAPTAIDGDERTPLLLKPAPPPSLPWLQLSVLLLLRLNEPICMLALVPVRRCDDRQNALRWHCVTAQRYGDQSELGLQQPRDTS